MKIEPDDAAKLVFEAAGKASERTRACMFFLTLTAALLASSILHNASSISRLRLETYSKLYQRALEGRGSLSQDLKRELEERGIYTIDQLKSVVDDLTKSAANRSLKVPIFDVEVDDIYVATISGLALTFMMLGMRQSLQQQSTAHKALFEANSDEHLVRTVLKSTDASFLALDRANGEKSRINLPLMVMLTAALVQVAATLLDLRDLNQSSVALVSVKISCSIEAVASILLVTLYFSNRRIVRDLQNCLYP